MLFWNNNGIMILIIMPIYYCEGNRRKTEVLFMTKTMKASMLRLAVIAMALVMLLGMLPAGVFAAGAELKSTVFSRR